MKTILDWTLAGLLFVGLLICTIVVFAGTSKTVAYKESPIVNKTTPLNLTNTAAQPKVVHNISLSPDQTVILVGEIGENAVAIASQITKKTARGKPVYLFISSPGGSVLDGAQIVNAVQSSKAPVYTVCYQLCASMAAIIFSYGNHRYMTDRSLLMYHEASGGFQGQFNQMRSRFGAIDKFVNKFDMDIAKRVGVDYGSFKTAVANEVWLDSEDAVRLNFADSIVNPDINALLAASPAVENSLSQVEALKGKFLVDSTLEEK